MQHLVVIGGTAAGLSAAAKAKRIQLDLKISVIERTGFTSYGSCGLPYLIGDKVHDAQDLITLTPQTLRCERGMDVYLHCEALSIDPKKKSVQYMDRISNRSNTLEYDKLVLATGASPVVPPCEGSGYSGVYTLRSVEDGIALRSCADKGLPGGVVIVGGGLIGLELAAELRERNIPVTVVEMLPRLLPELPVSFSEMLAREALAHGVNLLLSERVNTILGDSQGCVTGVTLNEGKNLFCQAVVFCVGVRPNSKLAREAGLEIGEFGGIRVDASMRTSDPNIWACGDCVETVHALTGKHVYMPLGTHANKQGKVAGISLAGGTASFHGVYGSQIAKFFDLFVTSTGLSERQATEAGFLPASCMIRKRDRASYYPGGRDCWVSLVYHRPDGKLLGGALLGGESVAGRANALAVALAGGLRVEDIAAVDFVYAPPIAPVYDPLIIAAEQAMKNLE